jgi:hypothetical protein
MSPPRPHAPYQALAGAVLLAGLLPLAFALVVHDDAQLIGAWFGFSVAGYLWASGGALVAALTFSAGDAQRPGWLWLSLAYLVLVPARLHLGPSGEGIMAAGEVSAWNVLVTTLLNGGYSVAGFLILTRAWRDTGLDTGSRAGRLAVQAGALLVALALAGPDLVNRLPPALHGDLEAVGDVVSDLFDMAILTVSAPVLRAALVLGGGLVAWPWVFLTAGVVSWLFYDASAVFLDSIGRPARVAEEVFRALATASVFAAGVAQRWVMTEMKRAR